jgi:hypothetical protein
LHSLAKDAGASAGTAKKNISSNLHGRNIGV